MGQKDGEKWTAAVDLQPTIPKSDRLLWRLLKRAEEIRLVADYKSDSVELSDAQAMVLQAETFVAAMHARFMPNSPSGDE